MQIGMERFVLYTLLCILTSGFILLFYLNFFELITHFADFRQCLLASVLFDFLVWTVRVGKWKLIIFKMLYAATVEVWQSNISKPSKFIYVSALHF